MRALEQLSRLYDSMPIWLRVVVGLFLVGFSFASVYGRIDTRFGRSLFSRIPESEIRSDVGHILGYTVVPVLVTLGFAALVITRW